MEPNKKDRAMGKSCIIRAGDPDADVKLQAGVALLNAELQEFGLYASVHPSAASHFLPSVRVCAFPELPEFEHINIPLHGDYALELPRTRFRSWARHILRKAAPVIAREWMIHTDSLRRPAARVPLVERVYRETGVNLFQNPHLVLGLWELRLNTGSGRFVVVSFPDDAVVSYLKHCAPHVPPYTQGHRREWAEIGYESAGPFLYAALPPDVAHLVVEAFPPGTVNMAFSHAVYRQAYKAMLKARDRIKMKIDFDGGEL